MAVLLNNQRVDGIDWERVVEDHRGKKFNCSGWHRHVWKPTSLDLQKECLLQFSPLCLTDFVGEGFKILNVQLRKGGPDDDNRLLFD